MNVLVFGAPRFVITPLAGTINLSMKLLSWEEPTDFIYVAVQGVVDLKLFKLGNAQLTLLTVIYPLAIAFLLVRFTATLHNVLLARYLSKTKMDIGVQQTIGTVTHYVLLFLGIVILLQSN